jgi:hypothetical protein
MQAHNACPRLPSASALRARRSNCPGQTPPLRGLLWAALDQTDAAAQLTTKREMAARLEG